MVKNQLPKYDPLLVEECSDSFKLAESSNENDVLLANKHNMELAKKCVKTHNELVKAYNNRVSKGMYE